MKRIYIGVFYRSPTQNRFLETLINDFSVLDTNKNETHIIGDFNVNLLCDNKYILNEKNSTNASGCMVSKYKEFCQRLTLALLIISPARIISSSSTLLDHILSNSMFLIMV